MPTNKPTHTPEPELLCAGHRYTLCGEKGRELRWIKITDELADDMDLRHLHLYSAAPATAAERDRLKEVNAELLEDLRLIASEACRSIGDARRVSRAAILRAEGK